MEQKAKNCGDVFSDEYPKRDADITLASFQLKDEKSVSRKHITLSVATVKPGDGVSPSKHHNNSEPSLNISVPRTFPIRGLDQG